MQYPAILTSHLVYNPYILLFIALIDFCFADTVETLFHPFFQPSWMKWTSNNILSTIAVLSCAQMSLENWEGYNHVFFSGFTNLTCTNILATSMPSFLFTVLLCAYSLTSVWNTAWWKSVSTVSAKRKPIKAIKSKIYGYRPGVRSRWLDIESPRIIIIY